MPPEVPLETAHETIEHHAHESHESWVMGVALTAAILAALAAVTALLAEHSAQEAILIRLKASDNWSEFQANSIKEKFILGREQAIREITKRLSTEQAIREIVKNERVLSPEDRKDLEKYAANKERLKEEATEREHEAEKCVKQHTPLSASLTMFQLAIAIGAVSVLTKRRPFWYVAMLFGGVGVGFLGWGVWMWLQ